MWCCRRMEKLKLSEKVTNEQFLERIGEKKILLIGYSLEAGIEGNQSRLRKKK